MTVRGYYFQFYRCETQYLRNWTGWGEMENNQSTGTVTRFYGRYGELLWTSTAYDHRFVNWDPVWSIRVC